MIDGIAPVDAFGKVENNLIGGAYNLDNGIQAEQPSTLSIDDGSLIIEGDSVESTLIDLSSTAVVYESDASMMNDLMHNVSEIDANYKQTLDRMMDWPNFNDYLEDKDITLNESSLDDNTLGITHISNIEEVMPEIRDPLTTEEIVKKTSDHMHESLEKEMAFRSAGIEYAQDSSRWSISTHFWLSKVKLLTAAVSQLNNGLKTLFTSQ